jgi:hypothetical protein
MTFCRQFVILNYIVVPWHLSAYGVCRIKNLRFIEDINFQGYDAVWIGKCYRHYMPDLGEVVFTEISHSQFIVFRACY